MLHVSYLVLEKGCDPPCKDKANDTPLASEGHLEVVQFFVKENECSLFVQGEDNKTALDYFFYDHLKVEQYLHTVVQDN